MRRIEFTANASIAHNVLRPFCETYRFCSNRSLCGTNRPLDLFHRPFSPQHFRPFSSKHFWPFSPKHFRPFSSKHLFSSANQPRHTRTSHHPDSRPRPRIRTRLPHNNNLPPLAERSKSSKVFSTNPPCPTPDYRIQIVQRTLIIAAVVIAFASITLAGNQVYLTHRVIQLEQAMEVLSTRQPSFEAEVSILSWQSNSASAYSLFAGEHPRLALPYPSSHGSDRLFCTKTLWKRTYTCTYSKSVSPSTYSWHSSALL